MNGHAYRIKARILVPFSLVLAAVIAAFTWTAYRNEQRQHEEAVQHILTMTQQLQGQKLALHGRLMEALLPALQANAELETAFRERDRARLLAAAQTPFADMRARHHVTHFYFLGPDRKVFLRVHQPERRDDIIERQTARDAARNGTVATGVELGPLGTLTLRAVVPWRDQANRLIGFIEIGVEVEAIMSELHQALQMDIVLLIRKDLLDRSGWEDGMRVLGREAQWGALPSQVVTYRTLPRLPAAVVDWLAGKRGDHVEFEDGGRVFLAATKPLQDMLDRPVGTLLVINDVTTIRHAFENTFLLTAALSALAGLAVFALFLVILGRVEGDLSGAWHHLEGRVEERTRELKAEIEQRQRGETVLRETLHDLSRANAELERVAEIAAHDLQEPARSVVSFAQLLARRHGETLGREGREYLDFLVADARRMRALVKDLLAYTELWTVKAVGKEPVSVRRVVERVIDGLTEQVEASGARIYVAHDLPTVDGDSGMLTELFRHLIDNALKFHLPDQPPVISVEAARNGKEWVFSVADNGIGIDPEYLDKVFVAFRRLHPAGTFGGTGIGLAMARRIVERHRGRIWAESGLDRGSVIRFTLPVAPETETATED